MAFLEFRPTTPLYHYCGPGGFDGITDSGEIWLSDLQHANDPKELQLAEIADRALAELIENESEALEDAGLLSRKGMQEESVGAAEGEEE